MNDHDRKWAFVESAPRKDLETIAAAVIEQLRMAAGKFEPHMAWNGGEVCDELSTVLGNLGVSYHTLLAAKPRRRPKPKTANVPAMRKALKALISTMEITGGIQAHPEGPGTDVPLADPDWVDLAETYKLACAAMGVAVLRSKYDGKNGEDIEQEDAT
jgi:hypothetical protein